LENNYFKNCLNSIRIKEDELNLNKTKRIQRLCIKSANSFSGHGFKKSFSENTKLNRIIWPLFIFIYILFCSYYIINSITLFFYYNVLSNIRVKQDIELTFPAFIICSWGSEYPVDKAIFNCEFNAADCRIDEMFSFVRVLGKGTSSLRYCTRFNGKSNKTIITLLSSNKIGYDYGLSVSFLVPDHVRFCI